MDEKPSIAHAFRYFLFCSLCAEMIWVFLMLTVLYHVHAPRIFLVIAWFGVAYEIYKRMREHERRYYW